MKKNISISSGELCILESLWKANRPLAQFEILESLSEQKIQNRTSVYNMINKLLEKKLIKTVGSVPAVRNFSRTFSPTITADEYTMYKLKIYPDDSPVIERLLSSLVDKRNISEDVLKKVEAKIAKRLKEKDK